jgi:Fe2+ transport system protein FeoA
MTQPNLTLDKIKKGKLAKIKTLPNGIEKIYLIRFGICEGSDVFCLERLPGGTIIIQKNRQEIAIGYDLAKKIFISLN